MNHNTIVRNFKDNKITIRKLFSRDVKNAKKFQDFINSLVLEEAKISINKEKTLKEEKQWLMEKIKAIKNHKEVFLVAECDNKIIGSTSIDLGRWRESHVGNFGITIKKDYRGIGLGKYLICKILKLAKKELKPKPKIIRLGVFPDNKPAMGLYKKVGFKEVARIPKQIQYKGKLLGEVIMLLYL
jgi:RimJ/RimL family protein N-acetyltransferase